MGFGPSAQAKSTENSQVGVSSTALNNSSTDRATGAGYLAKGDQGVDSATNWFNSVANGNRDAGMAALAPDINRLREANQFALTQANAMGPRGGGRVATLFGRPFATNDQVNSMYTSLRPTAAANLAQIGQGQQGLGLNLLNLGNQDLGLSGSTNQGILGYEEGQQKIKNSIFTGIGQGAGAVAGALV